MPLLPFLLEDTICPHAQRRNMVQPEELLYPLKNILNELAQIERNNTISMEKNYFQANIDVQQFSPEEIIVKLSNNHVIVEGKHEERQDEHGFISRHFVRRFELPEDCDGQKLQSKLSTDGVLSIFAPKKPEDKQAEYKPIPVIMTGPLKSVVPKPRAKQQKKKE